MEIEAKWISNSLTFDQIIYDFVDNSTFEGYDVEVRWGGISRKYIDYYYDNSKSELFNNAHSLRLRTRYSSSNASNNNLNTLVNATWNQNWQKVQYKSTPYRYGAVWMRKEAGGCKISDGECDCNDANSILAGTCYSQHPAIVTLLKDHSGFNFSTNAPILEVVDYRYRIKLKKNNIDYFEISLDRIVNGTDVTYEVELELTKGTCTLSELSELFRLVDILEANSNYSLLPSISSKGGIIIDEHNWNMNIFHQTFSSSDLIRARNNITVKNSNVTSTGNLSLLAGNEIILEHGFEVKKRGIFQATISECSGGQLKSISLNNGFFENINQENNFYVDKKSEFNTNISISTDKQIGVHLAFNPVLENLIISIERAKDSLNSVFLIQDSTQHLVQISIISSNGQIVQKANLNLNEISLNLSSLPRGLYIMQILVDTKNYVRRDFIKY